MTIARLIRSQPVPWLPAALALATMAPLSVGSPASAQAAPIQIFQQYADASAAQVSVLASQVTALEVGANPARSTAQANSSRASSYAGVVDVAALEAAAPQVNQLYCYSNSPGEESCTAGTGQPTSVAGVTAGVGTAEGESKSVRDDATGTVAEGRVAAAGFAGPGFQIGAASSRSTVLTKDGKLTSLSSSRTEDIDIAGVLHIGSVTSEARTSLSGSASSSAATASTIVSDIQVAGIPVSLGEDGLVVAGQNIPTDQLRDIQEQVNAMLGEARITVEALPSSVETLTEDGTEGSAETTGLRLVFSQQLPQRLTVRILLGRASAFGAFRATEPVGFPPDDPLNDDPLPGPLTDTIGTPDRLDIGGLPVGGGDGGATPPSVQTAPTDTSGPAPDVALATSRPSSGPLGRPDLDFLYLCLLLATAAFALPFVATQTMSARTITGRLS